MERGRGRVAPFNPVCQAGRLSGNPLAMAAGRAQLDLLAAPGTYQRLEALSAGPAGRFFHAMLERGIYLPPAQFEAVFVLLAHTGADIDLTVEAATEAFATTQ